MKWEMSLVYVQNKQTISQESYITKQITNSNSSSCVKREM